MGWMRSVRLDGCHAGCVVDVCVCRESVSTLGSRLSFDSSVVKRTWVLYTLDVRRQKGGRRCTAWCTGEEDGETGDGKVTRREREGRFNSKKGAPDCCARL